MELDKLFEHSDCERALVRIAAGDPEPLGVIHKYMSRQIYAVAYAVLQDFSLADDVVQETYVKIIEKAFSYQKGTNARAWVLSIARNISIDYYRKRRFEYPEQDELADAGLRFDESTVLASMEVKKALDALSDEERQIVTLKLYAGLKHREIAPLLGITVDACKKKYQRASEKLREML